MAIDLAVADLLDETIRALTLLDFDRLQQLEKQISAFVDSGEKCSKESLNLILTKKRLLGLILHNCEANLKALNRLHGKHTRDQWEH
jgi:hypothetical protein